MSSDERILMREINAPWVHFGRRSISCSRPSTADADADSFSCGSMWMSLDLISTARVIEPVWRGATIGEPALISHQLVQRFVRLRLDNLAHVGDGIVLDDVL